MAKIFLNEGTEIEVKETKLQIRQLIREKVIAEKLPYNGEDLHFIEVTRIKRKYLPITETLEIPTDLYFKRILFIYD
jgi:hypothetical protein